MTSSYARTQSASECKTMLRNVSGCLTSTQTLAHWCAFCAVDRLFFDYQPRSCWEPNFINLRPYTPLTFDRFLDLVPKLPTNRTMLLFFPRTPRRCPTSVFRFASFLFGGGTRRLCWASRNIHRRFSVHAKCDWQQKMKSGALSAFLLSCSVLFRPPALAKNDVPRLLLAAVLCCFGCWLLFRSSFVWSGGDESGRPNAFFYVERWRVFLVLSLWIPHRELVKCPNNFFCQTITWNFFWVFRSCIAVVAQVLRCSPNYTIFVHVIVQLSYWPPRFINELVVFDLSSFGHKPKLMFN